MWMTQDERSQAALKHSQDLLEDKRKKLDQIESELANRTNLTIWFLYMLYREINRWDTIDPTIRDRVNAISSHPAILRDQLAFYIDGAQNLQSLHRLGINSWRPYSNYDGPFQTALRLLSMAGDPIMTSELKEKCKNLPWEVVILFLEWSDFDINHTHETVCHELPFSFFSDSQLVRVKNMRRIRDKLNEDIERDRKLSSLIPRIEQFLVIAEDDSLELIDEDTLKSLWVYPRTYWTALRSWHYFYGQLESEKTYGEKIRDFTQRMKNAKRKFYKSLIFYALRELDTVDKKDSRERLYISMWLEQFIKWNPYDLTFFELDSTEMLSIKWRVWQAYVRMRLMDWKRNNENEHFMVEDIFIVCYKYMIDSWVDIESVRELLTEYASKIQAHYREYDQKIKSGYYWRTEGRFDDSRFTEHMNFCLQIVAYTHKRLKERQ